MPVSYYEFRIQDEIPYIYVYVNGKFNEKSPVDFSPAFYHLYFNS